MADELKVWVIQYYHRHGVDAWPWFGLKEPSEAEVIETLADWEGEEADEWIEIRGPFEVPKSEEAANAFNRWDAASGATECADDDEEEDDDL